jgi:hypothetical protein
VVLRRGPGFALRRPQDRAFVGNIVDAIEPMAAVAEARQAGLKRYFRPDHQAIASINSPMQC